MNEVENNVCAKMDTSSYQRTVRKRVHEIRHEWSSNEREVLFSFTSVTVSGIFIDETHFCSTLFPWKKIFLWGFFFSMVWCDAFLRKI